MYRPLIFLRLLLIALMVFSIGWAWHERTWEPLINAVASAITLLTEWNTHTKDNNQDKTISMYQRGGKKSRFKQAEKIKIKNKK